MCSKVDKEELIEAEEQVFNKIYKKGCLMERSTVQVDLKRD